MQDQKPHQKDLRKGRYSEAARIYHVTTTTLNREPIFQSHENAKLMVNILKKSDQLGHSNTLAFVIIPDHIHWLFQLNQDRSLSNLIQSIKSASAHAVTKAIWQKGFYDHAIRKDEDIQTIARYVIANPVRAGLVKKVGDYPYWDAVWIL